MEEWWWVWWAWVAVRVVVGGFSCLVMSLSWIIAVLASSPLLLGAMRHPTHSTHRHARPRTVTPTSFGLSAARSAVYKGLGRLLVCVSTQAVDTFAPQH